MLQLTLEADLGRTFSTSYLILVALTHGSRLPTAAFARWSPSPVQREGPRPGRMSIVVLWGACRDRRMSYCAYMRLGYDARVAHRRRHAD